MGVPRLLGAAVSLAAMSVSACGTAPPDAAGLLQRTSQHMVGLNSFHFVIDVQGEGPKPPPVQDAAGEARPPDLQARANLRQGQVLLEVNLVYTQGRAYLRSFTGGWQAVSPNALAQYLDVRSLFDRQDGLFAALPDTLEPVTGKRETVNARAAYTVTGRLPAGRVHRLLPVASAEGDYATVYWIESPADMLWRARITGPLFQSAQTATMTFTFSRLNEPVSITPPPVG